ncbi:sulfurtransferase TusA family protein [Pseudooceanicola aestuarii]|uniref:sulfurtransferase TusA family protein n=1 Tax=Pseudooceanicola aestuarii TaxID=2697319 RepID=UPI001EF8C337|nr:sulfurtransferase TusA family protein [Pseudooceanicola aestuarii]
MLDRLRRLSYAQHMNAETLDARGMLCPLPVLRARKRLMSLACGAVLEVWTDDPAAIIDMPHFCAQSGHALLSSEEIATGHRFRIRKGATER